MVYRWKCNLCHQLKKAPDDECACSGSRKTPIEKALNQRALDRQEGGNHYKEFAIQPVEFIHRNRIGFIEGNAIKYLCRWRAKGGVEDLKKARHYIDLLIEMEAAGVPHP